MNKGPQILIALSGVLIICNFIFTGDSMDTGFWLRIASSLLLVVAMLFTIEERKKK